MSLPRHPRGLTYWEQQVMAEQHALDRGEPPTPGTDGPASDAHRSLAEQYRRRPNPHRADPAGDDPDG